MKSVGQTIFAFFEDYLMAQKGLRPGSIHSYRDTLNSSSPMSQAVAVVQSPGLPFRTWRRSECSTS
jgi:hypothetical protein